MHARRNTGDVAASPALDTDTFGQPQIAAIEIQDPSVRCLIRVLSDRLNCPDQCIGALCDHGAHDTGKPLRRQSHVIVDKRDQRCLRCSYTGIARICDINSGLMYSMIAGASLTAETALCFTILGNIVPAAALAAFIFVPSRLWIGVLKRPYHLIRTGRAWLSISLFMMTSPVVAMVFSETSMIVLGAYAEPAAVAFYQVARRVSELAIVCGAVAIYIALPKIARYYTLRRYDELQHTVDIANILTIIPSISVTLILIFGGDKLLLVFGPDFSGAYAATLILTVGRAVDQLVGPALEILLMTGQQVTATWINVVYGVLSISLSFALIPHYGQIGAAFATVSVGVLWKLNLYLIVRQRCRVEPCLLIALASRGQYAFSARRTS